MTTKTKKTKNTVGRALQEIDHLRWKQVVVDEALAYLGQFVSTDSYEPSTGIASPFSPGVAPQELIGEVMDEFLKQREGYGRQILEMMDSGVKTQRRKSGAEKRKETK